MSDNSNNTLQNRIDNIAIAYVNAHYDVTKMTATDYLQKFNTASKELFDAMKNN